MLTASGPKVIEFNCRFGDPETQVVLEMLDSPLGELLAAAAAGNLDRVPAPRWRSGAAVTVVIASAGYPGSPLIGEDISGAERDGILHAGTVRTDADSLVSAGGRVLSATAHASDLRAARRAAYDLVGQIRMNGSQFRTDIAQAAVEGQLRFPGAVGDSDAD